MRCRYRESGKPNKLSDEAWCSASETSVPHAAPLRIWQGSSRALRPSAVSVLGGVNPDHLWSPQGFLGTVKISCCRVFLWHVLSNNVSFSLN